MEFIATSVAQAAHLSMLAFLFQSLVGSGVYCDVDWDGTKAMQCLVSIPSREWSLLRLDFVDGILYMGGVSIPSREWSLLRRYLQSHPSPSQDVGFNP